MKHLPVDTAIHLADVQPGRMSRTERLERWADILQQHGSGNLATLRGTECCLPSERATRRADNSALSLAYNDPVLRAAGLAGDTYGDAQRFFDLPDNALHGVLCDCLCGAQISGSAAAARVRSVVPGTSWLSRAAAGLRRWFG